MSPDFAEASVILVIVLIFWGLFELAVWLLFLGPSE